MENNTMMKEPNMEPAYEFIGRLALVLFSQNMKMQLSTLRKMLVDNGYRNYLSSRAMASGVSAAYKRWEKKESNMKIPTTCGAIANTFVDQTGNPSWLNY